MELKERKTIFQKDRRVEPPDRRKTPRLGSKDRRRKKFLKEEVRKLLSTVSNIKHKSILMLVYSASL